MGLRLQELSLLNFRSYSSYNLKDCGPLTIFIGPNAVGKTNIIEAVQLLSTQSSFRHSPVSYLVNENASFAKVTAQVVDDARSLDFEMRIEQNRKKFLLNSKPKKGIELRGIFPTVTFIPDDLQLAKGASRIRRDALDSLGSQLNANYYTVVKDYRRVLQHKNKLLKEDVSQDLIESINELIITCGSQLTYFRFHLFSKILTIMIDYYREISQGKEELTSIYTPSWVRFGYKNITSVSLDKNLIKEDMSKALKTYALKERGSKRCFIGPHSDQIEFFLNGKNASDFGSQGQQRSIVLAYKLAEVKVIEEVLHQSPLLLLDDVMSELDELRRNALMEYIEGDIQTFITTTNDSYFSESLKKRARIVTLKRKD